MGTNFLPNCAAMILCMCFYQENLELQRLCFFVCVCQGHFEAHLPHQMKLLRPSGRSHTDLLLLAHRLHTQAQTLAKHFGKFIHTTYLAWRPHPCLNMCLYECVCKCVHPASFQSYFLQNTRRHTSKHIGLYMYCLYW